MNNFNSSPLLRMIPLALVAGVAGFSQLGAAKAPAAPKSNVSTAVSAKIPQGMAVATLSGGCFWSMEAIYKRVKGVKSTTPGYTGGTLKNPTYEEVCTETTGHAESLNIVYDPKVVAYGELVEILLTVLNPTQLNAQGADVGTSYRSMIWTRTPQEQKIAQAEIQKINAKHLWKDPIVTAIAPLKTFYRAEDEHQNYYDTHQDAGYCQAVIVPKLDKLRAKFGPELK